MAEPVIVWFRRDLRLADNPALHHARRGGRPVIPVYIFAPEEEAPWQPGAASRYWLHHSLAALAQGLREAGSRLLIRRGASEAVLRQLLAGTGAGAVYWNRLYEPSLVGRDRQLERALRADGFEVRSFPGHLLNEPDAVRTRQDGPFKVFTPFWKHCRQLDTPMDCVPGVRRLPAPQRWPAAGRLEDLDLLPRVRWYDGIAARWTPGWRGAAARLRRFAGSGLETYAGLRDVPGRDGVSLLSPHLHFGEVSPRQVIRAAADAEAARGRLSPSTGADAYVRQIFWRDFAHHLLYHFPRTPSQPLYDKYRSFPWKKNRRLFDAWTRGQTGYPVIDAGMRELWHTGWMHNRVRMLTASFLVKDLLVHWRKGAAWFWDTLVDADLANNTLGWQWVAGCGADAAPFFRIFNPLTQGERFDPGGDYVRRWVPELAELDDGVIHKPWQAGPLALQAAGLRLGRDYPEPVVDHGEARRIALQAYRQL